MIPVDRCLRASVTVDAHTQAELLLVCMHTKPCPHHAALDPPPKWRTLAESARYTIERVVATLIALELMKHFLT